MALGGRDSSGGGRRGGGGRDSSGGEGGGDREGCGLGEVVMEASEEDHGFGGRGVGDGGDSGGGDDGGGGGKRQWRGKETTINHWCGNAGGIPTFMQAAAFLFT